MPTIKQYPTNKQTNKQSRYLFDRAGNRTSQNGEDGIIISIFNKIHTLSSGPWCVEFGAWDGKLYSNTYNLIIGNRWKDVLIEGNKERFSELQETYKGVENVHLVCAIVSCSQGHNSLDHILQQTAIPTKFDFLSIDIDGNDWFVWESLVQFRPRVVVIEFNPTIPNDVLFVQDRGPMIHQGCSLRALVELGKSKGYELICTTDLNGFFVVKEEFDKFGIEDNSIDAMHAPLNEGKIFHGYDGTIYTVGMPRLIWTDRPIASDELQVLPKEERRYGEALPEHLVKK